MLVSMKSATVGAALTLLSCVAVHVSLQRAGPCEALVADLALVLLLGAAGDLGAELSHHGLWCRGLVRHQTLGARERPGTPDRLDVGAGCRVVADASVNGSVVGAEACRGHAGGGRVC